MMKNKLWFAVIAIVCFFVGVALYVNFFPRTQPEPVQQTEALRPASVIGLTRPDFSLLNLEDQSRSIQELDGQVVVLNFWATWCPPCVREIPALIQVQEQFHSQGVTVLGVALDSKQAVIDFIDPMGVTYPVLLAEHEGIALTQAYGNHLGGLPYTVIIDRTGQIRHAMMREVSFEEVAELIRPLL